MTALFYFSSTGNSLDIARQLQQRLGGEIHYIPHFQGKMEVFDRLIIVSPIYSFGLPVHTENFLHTLPVGIPCYIILNYGGMAASAPYYAYCAAVKCGLDIRGVFTVKMPENYTLSLVPPQFFLRSALKGSRKKITWIANAIEEGKTRIPRKPGLNLEKIYRKNRANWHLIAAGFSVNEDCIHCNKCVSLCPAGNISVENGKVTFQDHCVGCLGCYHRCPRKAINYKNQTQKKPRYVNPNVNEADITQ